MLIHWITFFLKAFPINWLGNYLYTKDQRKSPIGIAPPESRLYLCCIGGVGVRAWPFDFLLLIIESPFH